MHSTPIFLLAFGLLATIAMARPGKRPWPHHEQRPEGSHGHRPGGFHGNHGDKWSLYRLPKVIRLPRLLAGKLEEPRVTFVAKKIFNGKYLVISPALIFKFKDTDIGTTVAPESSTQRPTTEEPEIETTTTQIDEESTTTEPEVETTTIEIDGESTTIEPEVETTTIEIDEESTTTEQPDVDETTTEAIDEESTTTEQPDEEESTTVAPSFKKRSFSINNNEQLLFLDD